MVTTTSTPQPPLTPEEKLLFVLRDELYGGSWNRMLDDLRSRLAGRPFVFKLAQRIQDDIDRIQGLLDGENRGK